MKQKILIVDDYELNRELLRDILEDDYEMLEAENGRIGLDIIDEYNTELSAVLLDLVMPRMNGFDFLDNMKEKGLLSKIPVVVISSDTSLEITKHCQEYGVENFLVRPFNQNAVREKVLSVIQNDCD